MNTTNPTSTAKKTPIKDSVEHALGDLEAITKEIEDFAYLGEPTDF